MGDSILSLLGNIGGGAGAANTAFSLPSLATPLTDSIIGTGTSLVGDAASSGGGLDSILNLLGTEGFKNAASGIGGLAKAGTGLFGALKAGDVADEQLAMSTDAFNRSVEADEKRQNLNF